MADKKFSPMRYTASSEAAAVSGALQIVGAVREDVEYEVLEQSAKGVTIRIRPRSADAVLEASATVVETPLRAPSVEALDESAPIAEDVPELLAQSDIETEATEAEEADSLAGDEESELDALAADFAEETPDFEVETPRSQFSASETPDIEASEAVIAARGEAEVAVETEIEPPDAETVARAQQTAQQMLDKMGLDAQVQIERPKEDRVVALVVDGEDVGILIGKHGATLQAFQYLLNLTLNAHLEGEEARQSGARVVVDAGNYRARRQSALEQIARGAASKVRREGRLVRLDPMPAHERRLVHMFLQTEAEIVTQSEGREPLRRIVVSPGIPGATPPPRPERASGGNSGSGGSGGSGGNRSGFGAFRRGDAQSERNRGLQRGR